MKFIFQLWMAGTSFLAFDPIHYSNPFTIECSTAYRGTNCGS